jgi:hypothetical protein
MDQKSTVKHRERQLLQKALDKLALLILSKHTWTNKELSIYERTTEIFNVK